MLVVLKIYLNQGVYDKVRHREYGEQSREIEKEEILIVYKHNIKYRRVTKE